MCCVVGDYVSVYASRTATFGGLMVCGSVWTCAVCESKIIERRKAEIQQVFKSVLVAGGTTKAVMITFTLPHDYSQQLAETLGFLKTGLDKFRSGAGWVNKAAELNFVGAINATEITYSDANGWHPHQHVIWFIDAKTDVKKLKKWIFERWLLVLKQAGFTPTYKQKRAMIQHAIDIHDNAHDGDYLAKMNAQSENSEAKSTWGAEAELTQNSTKANKKKGLNPFGLLAKAGELEAVDELEKSKRFKALFAEYAKATKGKRRIRIDSKLLEIAGLKDTTEEQLAVRKDEKGGLLGLIKKHAWYTVILKNQKQAAVLNLAEIEGKQGLERQFLDDFISENADGKCELLLKDQAERLKEKRKEKRKKAKESQGLDTGEMVSALDAPFFQIGGMR